MFCKKIRPEKYVGDYIVSKQCGRKKFPLLERPEVTLERQRVKLLKCEERLLLKREEFKVKREEYEKQWDDIESTGLALKQNCHKFNKFVIENMEKRKRAHLLNQDHKKMTKQREDSINKLQLDLATGRAYLNEIEKESKKYSIYETYLNEVVDIASPEDNFKNISNIIELYEYYVELSIQLANKLSDELQFLQNVKTDLLKFHHAKQNKILAFYVQIASLQGRYEDACRRTRHLEILVFNVKDKTYKRYTDLKFTKSSIWNLYQMMSLRKRYKMDKLIKKDDLEHQLIFISKTFQQICILKQQVNKALKQAAPTRIKK